MLKPFSLIFFVVVLVWLGSIFLTSDSVQRIERACAPVAVSEKVATAATQLAYDPWAQSVQDWMLKAEYGCRFLVWKTFYEVRGGARHIGTRPARAELVPLERADEGPAQAHPTAPAGRTRTDEVAVVPTSVPAPPAPGTPATPSVPSDYFDSK